MVGVSSSLLNSQEQNNNQSKKLKHVEGAPSLSPALEINSSTYYKKQSSFKYKLMNDIANNASTLNDDIVITEKEGSNS